MTNEEPTVADYANSLTPSKILIGVLNQIKSIEIPLEFFKNVADSQLEVKINESEDAFVFSLKENNGN